MFLKSYNWRQDNGIESICLDFVFHEREAYTPLHQHGFFGVDKIGRPIYVNRIGTVRSEKLLKVIEEDRLFLYEAYMFELGMKHRMLACSHLYDRQINQQVQIFDISGFNMSAWTKQNIHFLKKALQICMDYYPEVLGKLFLVNCPYVFSGIWAIIKSWLDERIRKKVSIFSRDHYKAMSEYIDDD